MPDSLRALRLLTALSFKAAPKRSTLALVLTMAAEATGVVIALLLKAMVDRAGEGDERGVVVAAVLLAAAVVGSGVGGWAAVVLRSSIRERATLALDRRLAEMSGTIPGVEHHERPDFQDEMAMLRWEHENLVGVHDAVVLNCATLVRLVATVAVLGSVHPALWLVPLFGVPSVWAVVRIDSVQRRLQEEIAPHRRMDFRMYMLALDREAGKELRVFGLGDEVLRRYDAELAEVEAAENSATLKIVAYTVGGWLAFGAGFAAALVLIAHQVVRGQASPGDLVITLTLAAQVNQGVTGLVGGLSWLARNLRTARRFLWLVDYSSEASRSELTAPVPVPAALAEGIHLRGVSFRYPATSADVMSDVNLFLPAGSTVAIVGDNGAGKTTLVKLLCRFYEPTAGCITVDGTDLRTYGVEEWRKRISSAFQDFMRFEFVALETVGLGELAHLDDGAKVGGALERAHASDVVAGLPDGLATPLGHSFEGGSDLSAGQWQKFALARAMMREQPLLLVLDEPTAALDAATEHALFERFSGAARGAADQAGAITLLVSHRFSTVRMADLIVVIEGGRIAEVGTHAELISAGGLYAQLHALQARSYT